MIASTSLSRKQIMCCIIFTGTKSNDLVETGLDLTTEKIGDVSDNIFLQTTVVRASNSPEDQPIRM